MKTQRVLLLLILLISPAGCTRADFLPPPNLPAAYYNCLEAKPQDLVALYTVHYFNTYASQVLYDNQVFIFKNIETTPQMLAHLNEGYAWVGDLKCLLADGSLRRYKPGQKFDMVGLNLGVRHDQEVPFCLLFRDCYVIPPGSVQLPAGGAAPVVPGY